MCSCVRTIHELRTEKDREKLFLLYTLNVKSELAPVTHSLFGTKSIQVYICNLQTGWEYFFIQFFSFHCSCTVPSSIQLSRVSSSVIM